MKYEANSVDEYIAQLPEDRKEAVAKLRSVLTENTRRFYRTNKL